MIKLWPFLSHESEQTSVCWPFFMFYHSDYSEISLHPFLFKVHWGDYFFINILFYLFYFQTGGNEGTTMVLFYGLLVIKFGSDVTWVSIFPLFFHYSSNDTSFQLLFLLLVRHWTTHRLFLGFIPFFWIETTEDRWYIHILILMFIVWEKDLLIASILPLFFIYNTKNRFDIILFFIFSYSSYDGGGNLITIPILLSGLYWEKGEFYILLLLVIFFSSSSGFTFVVFPLFWIDFHDNNLSTIMVIPIFAYSNKDLLCCGRDRKIFIFILIPTMIRFEDHFTNIYSVLFCRFKDYGDDCFYSVLLILFIYSYDKESTDLWLLAPCFRFSKRLKNDFVEVFFLPTLTYYRKEEGDLFISLLYFIIGYHKTTNDTRVWFIPLFFSLFGNNYQSHYYLCGLGSYSFSKENKETKRISWLIPFYFYHHIFTDTERVSIFVWVFPIFIYKDPGGFLKRLINGNFEIGEYTIENHFLFLYITVKDKSSVQLLENDTKTTTEKKNVDISFILYGLIGFRSNMELIYALPLFYYSYDYYYQSNDYFIIPLLLRIKTGKEKIFAFYFGLLYWSKNIKKGEKVLLFFYIFSYSLFRLDTKVSKSFNGTHLRTSTFYIYFIYYYEHVMVCSNNKKVFQNRYSVEIDYENEKYQEYLSTEFLSIGWIWVHYALFSYRNDYTIHYKLISIFLLLRYEENNGYLTIIDKIKKEKFIKISIFWIALDKIALLRFEHLYNFDTYEFIFCIPVIIHYYFKETVKNLEKHKSKRFFSISILSVLLHYYTALFYFENTKNDNNQYNIYLLPFFGYSKVINETNPKAGLKQIDKINEISPLKETDDVFTKDPSLENVNIKFWILFITRYSFKDYENRITILPFFFWDSDLTYWFTILRIVYTDVQNDFEARFLYRLILFTNHDEKRVLEINPFYNSENSQGNNEWNICGGIIGKQNQNLKICCCCYS